MANHQRMFSIEKLRFYLSQPHPCGYFPGRQAASLFSDPLVRVRSHEYGLLIEHGFRRSGTTFYRPECTGCSACIPIRIDPHRFSPNRSQRRNMKRNLDISMAIKAPYFSDELFNLYRGYLRVRHADGGMDNPQPDDMLSFLTCKGVDTKFYEFRAQGTLVALAVVDYIPQAISAVYTFFDPHQAPRGLGTYAILQQIEAAKCLNLTWVYLGYWIPDCAKMTYKQFFKPAQIYRGGTWLSLY